MQIEKDFSLKNYNTFHIECKAKYFAHIVSASDFIDLLKSPERKMAKKILFIGGGSNMLFTKDTFDGLVIHSEIMGKEITSDNDNEIFLKVWGGENRSDFVWRTIEQGLYGIENLVSIPGSVAAAPIQNIGAYGMDVSHSIVSVGWISLNSGTYETISHKECLFWYRDSVFKSKLKNEFFITDVTFRLQHYNADTYAPVKSYGNVNDELTKNNIVKPSPRDIAMIIADIRANKLPDIKKVGTAGSFFKNVVLGEPEYAEFLHKLHILKPGMEPEVFALEWGFYKVPTWRILDHVFWYRGHRDGNVGCREQQALCIVNYGSATGHDVVKFAEKLQKQFHNKLGLDIEPEVNFIS